MSKIKFPHLPALVGLILLMLTVVTSVSAQAKTAPAKESKLERLLKETSANYMPFQGPRTFVVTYKGKDKPQIDVILIEADESVLMFADVAAGKEIDLTPEMMKKLLQYNMHVDYIKVGISDLGSIRVQTEQDLTPLTGKVFEKILDQVAAGTDEVTKLLAPVRKGPAAVK